MGSESSAFRSPIASCGAIGASVGGVVMSIAFTQKPINPSQPIEVTLCFANGLVLSKEVAVQIKEQRV